MYSFFKGKIRITNLFYKIVDINVNYWWTIEILSVAPHASQVKKCMKDEGKINKANKSISSLSNPSAIKNAITAMQSKYNDKCYFKKL